MYKFIDAGPNTNQEWLHERYGLRFVFPPTHDFTAVVPQLHERGLGLAGHVHASAKSDTSPFNRSIFL